MLETLNVSQFNVHFYRSLTNYKFMLFTNQQYKDVKPLMKAIYMSFASIVLKDPCMQVNFI
jgi:hypothetical protein